MAKRLLHDILLQVEAGSTASSTGRTSGATMDMTGWDGALGIGIFDTSGAGNGVYWQDGSATAALSPTTGIADCANSSIAVLDVWRPNNRYGGFVMTASGLAAKRSRLITILYGPRNRPTSGGATNFSFKLTQSPAAGAATA